MLPIINYFWQIKNPKARTLYYIFHMKLHKDYSTEFDKLNLVQFLYGDDLKKSNIRAYKYKIKK